MTDKWNTWILMTLAILITGAFASLPTIGKALGDCNGYKVYDGSQYGGDDGWAMVTLTNDFTDDLHMYAIFHVAMGGEYIIGYQVDHYNQYLAQHVTTDICSYQVPVMTPHANPTGFEYVEHIGNGIYTGYVTFYFGGRNYYGEYVDATE